MCAMGRHKYTHTQNPTLQWQQDNFKKKETQGSWNDDSEYLDFGAIR